MTSHRAEDEPFTAAGTAPERTVTVADLPLLDVSTIVEEAEQFLRESAPHDFDVLVIGAGPGGSAAALRAAQLGIRVGLVEQGEIGGASLNRTVVPLHALLANPDFSRMRRVIHQLRQATARRLTDAGVRLLAGRARFVSEHTVKITTEDESTLIKAVHIVIAVGTIPIARAAQSGDLYCRRSLDDLLAAREVPDILVISGNPFEALETATLFQKLGSRVAVNFCSEAGIGYDDELVEAITAGGSFGSGTAQPDATLLDLTRQPSLTDFGLEAIGMAVNENRIVVDEFCETSVTGVYAVGGCVRATSVPQLAAAEGTLVAERIVNRVSPGVSIVPYCFRTAPPVAYVGLSEREARLKGFEIRAAKARFAHNHQAVLAGDETGWVKIVVDAETEKLLGCQIVGTAAREIVNCVALALSQSQNVDEFTATMVSYPSFCETLCQAALGTRGGNWRQAPA